MAGTFKGSDGKAYASGTADNKGTVGREWSAAEIVAQSDAVRKSGNYWHPLLGGVALADYALLSASDKLLCLAPI